MKFLLILLLLGGCRLHQTQSSPPDSSGGGETSVSIVTVKVDENGAGITIPVLTNINVSVGGFVETNGFPGLVLDVEEPQPPPKVVLDDSALQRSKNPRSRGKK